MSNEGWNDWMHDQPPFGCLILVWRESWGLSHEAVAVYREEIYPETNVYGLKWKLTGIGRMEIEAE